MRRLAVIILTAALILKPVPVGWMWYETTLPAQYRAWCYEIGERFGVSPELLMAIIEHESRGNPNVTNKSSGCAGLCQIDPVVHADRIRMLGITDIYDPYSNIVVCADLLVDCCNERGDLLEALDYYGGYRTDWQNGQFSSYSYWVANRTRELEIVHRKVEVN